MVGNYILCGCTGIDVSYMYVVSTPITIPRIDTLEAVFCVKWLYTNTCPQRYNCSLVAHTDDVPVVR